MFTAIIAPLTRTPTNPVSECSAIAGLVALTTAASRWRHCVPFVPFAAPLCSLFPCRVTCAPFENFYFVILNPFFYVLADLARTRADLFF